MTLIWRKKIVMEHCCMLRHVGHDTKSNIFVWKITDKGEGVSRHSKKADVFYRQPRS